MTSSAIDMAPALLDVIPSALEDAPPALLLTGLYAALALLLLSLHLKSAWPWTVKSAAVALVVPATTGTFLTIDALLGWPNHGTLPANFQLHAALVEEPAPGGTDDGAIFLWLTPWEEELAPAEIDPNAIDLTAAAGPMERRPRAFDLPYSRTLHQEVDSMRERLARGELVTGRHRPGDAWQRRFGKQHGGIDLEAPPPPPLPSKNR